MSVNIEDCLEKMKEIARGAGEILLEYYKNKGFSENTKYNHTDIVTDADLASDKYIREKFAEYFPGFGVITEEGSSIQPANPGPDELWLCADPLDGTTDFSRGLPIFCVSIGLLDVNYQPVAGCVYDPTRDEMFYAIKGKGSFVDSTLAGKHQLHVRENTELINCLLSFGFNPSHLNTTDNNIREIQQILPKVRCLRCLGSCCLDFCNVASARLDGYWEFGPHIWDVAAGWIIATEAGCIVTHYDGSPFTRESLMLPKLSMIVASPAIHKLMLENIKLAREGLPLK